MNKSALALLTCVLALPLAAQQPPANSAPVPGAQPTGPSQQMHAHMQVMQEQMARIHATQDPAERQRLMQEHMQSMQANMAMMGRMGQMGQGRSGGASQCAQGDTACQMQELQTQHGMMQERMGMMQQMMGQMMQHMQEAQPPAAK